MGTVNKSSRSARSGTQSVERALWILKEVGSANATGCTMQTLVEQVGLNRTTVYRLVKCLLEQGAIQQNVRSKRIYLGPLALALGVAAQQQLDLKQIFSPSATRLAEATGDTCFVMLRSGTDAVCIDRRLGSYPIKTLTVEVGMKRPLGIGAGSLAILAAMPESEISSVIRANARLLPRYGQSPASLMKSIRTTQKQGYVAAPVHELEQVIAIGLPVLDRMQKPIAALSITAIAERMQSKRRPELLELLQTETKHLHETLRKTNLMGS
jgi:DNA-binding IclR family transcriptional regulator